MSGLRTVAVVGGGVAGLSAAGLLARQGLQVTLYEAGTRLGGCCGQTAVKGYIFNDGALYLALPGILDHVFARLGLDRAAYLPLRRIVAVQTCTLADGTVVSIGDGLHVTARNDRRRIDNERMQRELRRMLARWEPVLRLFADDILLHPLSAARLLTRGWRHLLKLRGTVASEMFRLFSDEAVRAAMAGASLYSGVPPEQMPAPAVLGLVAMLTEGFYLPENGMQQIPEALSQALTNHGGRIHLRAPIRKILVRNGRVTGLDVTGQGLAEFDAVVSTVSGMLTFGSLLDPVDVPPGMQRRVERAPLSCKTLAVQLGLSNTLNAPSHCNSVLPMMEQQAEYLHPGTNDTPWLYYNVPTVTLPELTRRGGSIVEIYPPIRQDLSANQWSAAETARAADAAIAALARRYNLDIAAKRVLSPKDFQDRLHLYQGAIYGLSPAAGPRAQFPHRTPIRGLYQAGQTTYPGYGVSCAAMSGILAADALMEYGIG